MFGNVTIGVKDMDESIRFCRDVPGFTVVSERGPGFGFHERPARGRRGGDACAPVGCGRFIGRAVSDTAAYFFANSVM